MPSSHPLQFIGGLAFFFYGLYIIHRVLQNFAGDRLKSMIARTTQNRFRSLITGIVVTFFFQSSSAVTVMSVGLVSSGLMSLEQAMAVSLGAGIGTTFVVLLMAIKTVVQYGIVVIVVGLVLKGIARRKVTRNLSGILVGFGFIFFGLTVMAEAATPLKDYPIVPQIFSFMEHYPLTNFIIAAVITALVHSSGVILGLLVSLAFSGSVTLPVAIPLMLGANVGTSFTAVMASFGAKTDGKRLAWATLFLRVGAALLIYPFLPQFTLLIEAISRFIVGTVMGSAVTVSAEISLSHFFYNVLVAILFLPFLPLGKKIVTAIIPSKPDEEETFGPKYLDKSALDMPALALTEAARELVRMGEIVQGMFRDCLTLFEKYDLDHVDDIKSRDHKVDTLYKAIKFYLAGMALNELKGRELQTGIYLMTAVTELENIGDTIDRHVGRLAHKKWTKGVSFSEEGWNEICEMHKGTGEMFRLALAMLSSSSAELVHKMRDHEKFYSQRESQITASHLKRLGQGLKESIETSTIHLELLSLFKRINLSLVALANALLPEKED